MKESEIENEKIGIVSNFFEKVSVVAIKLEKPLKIGEKIRIVGGESDFEQDVESIQIHNEKVESAGVGDEIGMKVDEKVRKGCGVYRA